MTNTERSHCKLNVSVFTIRHLIYVLWFLKL